MSQTIADSGQVMAALIRDHGTGPDGVAVLAEGRPLDSAAP